MHPKYLLAILVLLALFAVTSPIDASGVVDVCDEVHLLAALAGGGTVTFACSGTITLTSTITIEDDTTLNGSGQTVNIDGDDTLALFVVSAGATLHLDSLALVDGYSTTYDGGALFNAGTVTIDNCTFASNTATWGGAIVNWGSLTAHHSVFSENQATYGGAIFNNYSGIVTIVDSSFLTNHADRGGAIFNNLSTTTLNVHHTTFSGNSAFSAGGAIQNEGTLVVSNSTFFNNSSSSSSGGALSNGGFTPSSSASATLTNATIAGNTAASGGGIMNTSPSTVTLKNSIVSNNPATGNCAGDIVDGGGNLSYPDTTCPGIHGDPVLGTLQNNGGPTATMALGADSAAFDAAVDATCAAAPVNSLDQRGIGRPQGAHCDIGAFEAAYCPNFVPPATVGIEDIQAIATRWGWNESSPGWDPAYDLNRDLRIDMIDIMLVARAWGTTCSAM